jgi:uncharacterized protein (TIGR02246 family)
MKAEKGKINAEAQIRKLVDDWLKAVRAKDIDGVMSHYAPDIRSFDVMPPLQYEGVEAYRKLWEMCFNEFPGSIGFEIRDLRISAGDEVAFCHHLSRFSGTTKKGEEIDNWMRATVCFRKIDGQWLVTHEHASVPVDPESSKALFNLKP